MNAAPHALIAEDEPLLAAALRAELAALWPALQVAEPSPNGTDALARLLAERPDVAFLDIRMPGLNGIEVARALVEDWPAGTTAPPLLVFVTAYDEFAVAAFEHAAVDYVVKPVRRERLARTCERLRERLATSALSVDALAERMREVLRELPLASEPSAAASSQSSPSSIPELSPLRFFRAGVGDTVRLIPVDEVLALQADDKYVSVVTREGESLIRESLRELLPRLDAERFVQVHRSTIVNLDHVAAAVRDDAGRLRLRLRGTDRTVLVSRLYAHLFKAM